MTQRYSATSAVTAKWYCIKKLMEKNTLKQYKVK